MQKLGISSKRLDDVLEVTCAYGKTRRFQRLCTSQDLDIPICQLKIKSVI